MIIGITGLVLSGKSSFAGFMKKSGVKITDCDEVSRLLTGPKTALFLRIKKTFGNGVVDDSGLINRKKLAALVFSDRKKLAVLEKIQHSAIIKYLSVLIKNDKKNKMNIIEASLLFESGLYKKTGLNIFIDAASEDILARSGKRGLGIKMLKSMLSRQREMKDKFFLADIVVRNRGTLKALEEKSGIVLELIKKNVIGNKREKILL